MNGAIMKFGHCKESILCFLFFYCLASVCTDDQCSDDETQYRCSNERCVTREALNNSINDCGDNSDEVAYPCRKPMYSCKNDRCVLMFWVLDGKNDCIDGSDEAKVIGTPCNEQHCCPCADFVAHSNCIEGTCQCIHGYYSNDLGTACLPRIVGSNCAEDADCTKDISLSSCLDSFCVCAVGFGPSADHRACRKRDLNDACSTDSDCYFITNVRCHHGYCRCLHGHTVRNSQDLPTVTSGVPSDESSQKNQNMHSADITTVCLPNYLSDSCLENDHCLPKNSKCISGACACPMGYYPSTNGTSTSTNISEVNTSGSKNVSSVEFCRVRMINDACKTNEECSAVIGHSLCGVTRRCACADAEQKNDNGMITCLPDRSWVDIIIMMSCTAAVGCLCIFDLFLIVWICQRYLLRERTWSENSKKRRKTSSNGCTASAYETREANV